MAAVTVHTPLPPEISLRHLELAAAEFADVLAEGDLAARVPACPEWTTTRLAHHLGSIHRWARHAVAEGSPGPDEDETGPSDRSELVAWFSEGSAALTAALRAAGPDAPCWTFGPKPRTAAFWFRRQAHETAMHTWDAKASQGAAGELGAELALDGIDEVATMFLPRQLRLGRLPALPAALAVEPDGAGRGWVLGEPGQEPAAALHGEAEALLLLIWGRATLDHPAISVEGDPDVAAAVLAAPITP